jgi:hypothetical protein
MSAPASPPSSNPSIVVDRPGTSATSYYAYDSNDRRFFIRGRVDTYTDYLTFRISTRILSTGHKSAVSPEEFFDAMMAHFRQQPGGMPAAIHAIWDDKDPEFVTNLARFNAALAAGADEKAAAGATFTGRVAKKHNYNDVVPGVTDPPNGPPPYRKVNVYFKR